MSRVRAILRPNSFGGFWVEVPSLPGCVGAGPTREAAIEDVYDALGRAVNAYRGMELPVPWQPDAATRPGGESIELDSFWDFDLPTPTPEESAALEAQRERNEAADLADVLREHGIDVR